MGIAFKLVMWRLLLLTFNWHALFRFSHPEGLMPKCEMSNTSHYYSLSMHNKWMIQKQPHAMRKDNM